MFGDLRQGGRMITGRQAAGNWVGRRDHISASASILGGISTKVNIKVVYLRSTGTGGRAVGTSHAGRTPKGGVVWRSMFHDDYLSPDH